MNTWMSDQVAGCHHIRHRFARFPFVPQVVNAQAVVPLLGCGVIARNVVIGRACTMKESGYASLPIQYPSADHTNPLSAHRCAVSSAACVAVSTALVRLSAGTGSSCVPSGVRTSHDILLSDFLLDNGTLAFSTTTVSGVTSPPTIASPNPQAAFMST